MLDEIAECASAHLVLVLAEGESDFVDISGRLGGLAFLCGESGWDGFKFVNHGPTVARRIPPEVGRGRRILTR